MTTKTRKTGRATKTAAARDMSRPAAPQSAPVQSLEATIAKMNEALAKFKALQQKGYDDRRTQSQLRGEMKAAAAREDFVEAARLKRELSAVEADRESHAKQLVFAAEAAGSARETVAALYFETQHHHFPRETKVTRVVVVDPKSGDSDDETYVDSGKTIELTVSGTYFESEAYHVGEWAAENGFLVKYYEGTVTL